MAKDSTFSLLSAQLRAYGGKIVPNVVDGHNVTAPNGAVDKFSSTDLDGENRETLLRHLRQVLAYTRLQGRYNVITGAHDGPNNMLAIVDIWTGNTVAYTVPGRYQDVLAGLCDADITR